MDLVWLICIGLVVLLLSLAFAKTRRQDDSPKMVIFSDSISDVGRGFDAPSMHQFEEYGIGPSPWKYLFAAPDSNEEIPAYMPYEGSRTNGKAWPTWLGVPYELNFATSSATASSAYRNVQPCTRYTGEGEDFPTGTLDEQITRYFHDIGDPPEETLGYTHVILIGNNDLYNAYEAIARYVLGGASYQDPIPLELIFETDPDTGFPVLDDSGLPKPTAFVIETVIKAWDDGIARLVGAGVTGIILLANMGSARGLTNITDTAAAIAIFDALANAARLGASELASRYPQIKILDIFTLTETFVDTPSIYEDLGFIAPEGASMSEPCMRFNFTVDGTAEIMGTQALRHPECQITCALCADATSPCQNCLEGNPTITVCDNPDTRVFYDEVHFSTAFHRFFGEAIRECSKDAPDFDRPLVSTICPPEDA